MSILETHFSFLYLTPTLSQHRIRMSERPAPVWLPRGENLQPLMRPKMNRLWTSVKGHLLNRFHVGSISVDLRSEVVTDTNVNKTHCQLKHLCQLCCSKTSFVTQPACVGVWFPEWDGAVRDQLALSQMFARSPDGWAALVLAAALNGSLCATATTTVAGV